MNTGLSLLKVLRLCKTARPTLESERQPFEEDGKPERGRLQESCYLEGPSTQYSRTLVPKASKGMVFGTRVLKYWVLGPSGGWFPECRSRSKQPIFRL